MCDLTLVTVVGRLQSAGVHVEHLHVAHVRAAQNELEQETSKTQNNIINLS